MTFGATRSGLPVPLQALGRDGKMRSNATGSLDAWHLALDFDTQPLLNKTFIREDPPVGRVIAVPSEPQFIGDFSLSFVVLGLCRCMVCLA